MGLANLSSLMYLLSIPILIYIYYFSRKKKRVEISSIIPWRLLKESVVRSSLFRADLLFLLQLIILLMLTLAAARPFWDSSHHEKIGMHWVVVLDRSASMQTREGQTSRFEIAKERLLKRLRLLAANDRVTLVAAGARPDVLASAESNPGRLESAVTQLSPADTPDSMSAALRMAFSLMDVNHAPGKPESTLLVLSDRSAQSLGFKRTGGAERVHVETIGSAKGNAGFTDLTVHRNIFSERQESSAYVTVENFSTRPFSGIIRASDRRGAIGEKPLSLPAGGEITTAVAGSLPAGEIELSLEPPDALMVDNRAFLLMPGRKAIRIVLFTKDSRFAGEFKTLTTAIPHITLDIHHPAAYHTTDLSPYAVAIFHRCEPEEQPATNILIICPPAKSRIVPVRHEWVSNAHFLDWDENHALGKNLRGLSNVELSGARAFSIPSWAKSVAISATGEGDTPLVLCGQYLGRKVVVMSFDLAESNLKAEKSLPLLLLLLNSLKYLSEGDDGQIHTGEPYEAIVPETCSDLGGSKTGAPYTLINPRGQGESVTVKPETPLLFYGTDYTGRYLLSGKAFEKTFVANLCSRTESDLLNINAPGDDQVTVEQVTTALPPPEVPPDKSPLFLLVIVILLAAEWLLWLGRSGKNVNVAVQEQQE